MAAIGPFLLGAATGAGVAYLFDPDMGNARRARMTAAVRRTGEAAQQQVEAQVHHAEEVVHHAGEAVREGVEEQVEHAGDAARKAGLSAQEKISGRLDQANDKLFGAVADALPDDKPANEQALVAKVRSEVLGDPRWKDRTINVDAAGGTVTLRGEVESAKQRDALVEAVEGVTGVDEVESLLHLPGEPAPNTEASRTAPTRRPTT